MAKDATSASIVRHVIVPGLLIVVIVIVLNIFIYERELGFFSGIYNNEVAGTKSLINQRIQSAVVAVESVKAFFLSSENVTEEEFNSFGSILTKNIGTGVIAMPITVEWVDAQNKIQYVYPMNGGNAKIVGLDLNRYPSRLIPITKAKSTRAQVVTEPVMLEQGYPGLLLYSPIYKGDTYLGEALVVIRLKNLLAPVSGSVPLYDKNEYIDTGNYLIPFDDDIILNKNNERIINPQGDTVPEPLAEEYSASRVGVVADDIIFADKTWQLNLSSAYITDVNKRAAVYSGFSFLFVLAIISFLWILHRQRRRLLEETGRTEALIGSIGDGIIASDERGVITFTNKRAEDLSGYNAEEAVGKSYYDVWRLVDSKGVDIPKNERPFYRALTHHAITDISVSDNLHIVTQGGVHFPIASTIAPILVSGEVKGAIAVFRDITKESEIDRMKSEFISLASHQLKTPITAVSWNIEMLLDGDAGTLNAEQKEVLEQIHETSKNMSELISGFLDVTKAESGGFAIERGDVDLTHVSDSLLLELAKPIADKKIAVIKKYGSDVPHLDIGTKTARVILQNLLTNAIKYTPTNGTVEIQIEKTAEGVSIAVKDTGYGIPEKAKGLIFTKLFRADNVRKKNRTEPVWDSIFSNRW